MSPQYRHMFDRLVGFARNPVQKGAGERVRLLSQQLIHGLYVAQFAGRYTFMLPAAQRFFTPWYAPEFRDGVFARVRAHTLLREENCHLLESLVRHARHLGGDFAECGIYRGGSAWVMANALAGQHALHLFDTFTGMPATAGAATDGHTEGDFGDTSLASVQTFLADFSSVHFHPGFIPDTFEGLDNHQWAFAHIDVDIYSSALACLEYFYPRMKPGGVILLDDYGYRIYEHAEKRAVDDFFATRPEKPIVLPTGQAMILKI